MLEVLKNYESISLDEMKEVQLMNRVDTKYVTTVPVLLRLLQIAVSEYRVQETGEKYNMPYYTQYFDTHQYAMYQTHLHGRKKRQKIRIRTYEDSESSFLEVKSKNNKGRTVKHRIPYYENNIRKFSEFIQTHSIYSYSMLFPKIENRFSRITLVNRKLTERLTIDTNMRFHNVTTGCVCRLENLVVIEVKRNGRIESPILKMLRALHIYSCSFSKYCIGMALTDSSLKYNRIKPRIRLVKKLGKVIIESEFN